MLILNAENVKDCQFKIGNQQDYSQGLLFLNRLFMEMGFHKTKDLQQAIEYDKSLLEREQCCIILNESDTYSVWCLVPEEADEIKTMNEQN